MMNVHIWITSLFALSFSKVIYSDSVIQLTATPYWNYFASHDGFDGSTHYPNNYTREWLITGETANYSILINITHCALENAKGKCLFDYLSMYDGSDSNASVLQKTCCTNKESFIYKPIVRSTDGTMYIVFETDATDNSTGFRINYILEGAPTTTLSTSTPYTTTVTVTSPASVQREDNTLIYIIIACAVTGFLITVMGIFICVICCKKKAKNRSEQHISKKFGRSTQRSDVVTSESNSHVILEDESCDPRVSTVQTRSPPPAYATVMIQDVNEVNSSAQVKTANNTDNQQKELQLGKSDNTTQKNIETEFSSRKKGKKKSKTSSNNVDKLLDIIEKQAQKTKTEKEKKSNDEKSFKDFDNDEAHSKIMHDEDHKSGPLLDRYDHTFPATLTKSQNQKDNNNNESTKVMTAKIVFVKENQNENPTYDKLNSPVKDSRHVIPVHPIDGKVETPITPWDKINENPSTTANESYVRPIKPVHTNLKPIKPANKTIDEAISKAIQNKEHKSTTIDKTVDPPFLPLYKNDLETINSASKSEYLPMLQKDKDDNKPISLTPKNNQKIFKSDNKREAVPISQEDKNDEKPIEATDKPGYQPFTPTHKNDMKTIENNNCAAIWISTGEKTEHSVIAPPAQFYKEMTPIGHNDNKQTDHTSITVLDIHNKQQISPKFRNDATIISNMYDKNSITEQCDINTKPMRPTINKEKSSLKSTAYGKTTENMLTVRTTKMDEKKYILHDQENKTKTLENEDVDSNDLKGSTNEPTLTATNKTEAKQPFVHDSRDEIIQNTKPRKHAFLSENDHLINRDMTVVSVAKSIPMDLNAKPIFTRPTNGTTGNSKSVSETTVFTVSTSNIRNVVEIKDIKSSTVPAPYRNIMPNNRPHTSDNQSKLAEKNYTDKMKTLKSIYYSFSNHGHSDKNLSRMRSQIDLVRPQTSKVNPWLDHANSDNASDNSNRRLTKATLLRRMRNIGVQEIDDDDIPQIISKAQAFTIIKSRTTLCDEDIVQSRQKILPPLNSVPKEKLPDLPKLWRPT